MVFGKRVGDNMQIKIRPKFIAPKIGNVVRYNGSDPSTAYMGLVIDTTCVQAKMKWLNHPTCPDLCTWVNIRSLEIIA